MLTSRDLAQIRAIVREEIERAQVARGNDDSIDAERYREIQACELIEHLHREGDERAARPIPDGPFVDLYDAARLLGVTQDTVNAWARGGRLTRHKAPSSMTGRFQYSRAEIDALATPRRR